MWFSAKAISKNCIQFHSIPAIILTIYWHSNPQMYLDLSRVHSVPGYIICSLIGPTWYRLLRTQRSETMPNIYLHMEVNKVAI